MKVEVVVVSVHRSHKVKLSQYISSIVSPLHSGCPRPFSKHSHQKWRAARRTFHPEVTANQCLAIAPRCDSHSDLSYAATAGHAGITERLT